MTWAWPDTSSLIWLGRTMVAWGILVGVIGAIQGILFTFGRLHMGCPRCNTRSTVTGGDRDGMHLKCPSCGDLRLKFGSLFGLKAIRRGTKEDGLSDYKGETVSLIHTPKRHVVPFMIIFSPVAASIITASIIHRFSFFYLLIPGFWCYGVGCMIIEALHSGSMSDNHGTALRVKTPFRFWSKLGVWFLFYLFALIAPVGFALQEHHKVKM